MKACLYKDLDDSYPQPDSDLAQWYECGTDYLEVVSSNTTGDSFRLKFILFCVTLVLTDNLTEMRLKGLT